MRSFIAIPLNESCRKQLQEKVKLLKKLPWADDIRWFPAENYHLTLQFLGGKLEPSKVQQVIDSMDHWFSEGMTHFEAEIRKIKLFPSSKSAHTIVASLDATIMMQYLVREIEDHIKPLGLSRSKQAFRPHISLGRIGKQAELDKLDIPTEIAECEDIWLNVDTITLYQSQLTEQAPIYTALKSHYLEYYN